MTIKRKRSESEFSLASSSTFSSPDRPFASSASAFSFKAMNRSATSTTPSHLPSRTMKRFRDGRPSEEIIHQRTLNMLYSAAQKQPQQQQPTTTQPDGGSIQHHHHQQQQQQHQHQPQQASLHNFWKLPPSSAVAANAASLLPPPSSSSLSLSSVYGPISCEDCGHSLGGGGADGDGYGNGANVDSMMDVDSGFGDDDEGMGGSHSSCGACGKVVCSHCSITNLGEQRRCLACAGRRVASGGGNRSLGTGGGLRWFATATAAAGVGVC